MPAKKCIYKSLKNGTTDDDGKKVDGHISHEEQLTCEKNWDLFDMKNMGDYHDNYLKKDALLLADIFENFVDTYVNFYGLDSCHYISSPLYQTDLGCDVKNEWCEVRKISDIGKYLFIEKRLN